MVPYAFGRSKRNSFHGISWHFMAFHGSSTRLDVCIVHRVRSAVQLSPVSISTRQFGSVSSASSVGMATQGHHHQVVRALPRVGEALSFSFSCATCFCSSGRVLLQRTPLARRKSNKRHFTNDISGGQTSTSKYTSDNLLCEFDLWCEISYPFLFRRPCSGRPAPKRIP